MSANPASSRRAASAPRWIAAAVVLGLLACGKKEEARPGPVQPDSAVLRSPASTALSHQSVAVLARGVIAETLEVPARILPDERRTTQVIAPADGRIEAVFVRTPDQAVRAGERLALLYSPELVAAQREYLLLDPGREAGMVRQAEERLSRMGLRGDQLRAIRAAGKPLEKFPITSPKDGNLILESAPAKNAMPPEPSEGAQGMGGGMGSMSGGGMAGGKAAGEAGSGMETGEASSSLRAGASVSRGTVLAQVNDLSVVSVVLTVPVRSLSQLREGDSVHLSLRDAGFEGMAAVDLLESRVADTSGNVEVRTYLPNPGFRLKPGLLGKAHIASGSDSAWVLPRTAVHDLGERRMVWVRDAADTGVFEAREIRVGRIGAASVEVIEGLAPGSPVAENASLLLDPDVVVEPRPIGDAAAAESHAGHGAAPDHAGHGETAGGTGAHAATGEASGHAGHGTAASGLTLSEEQIRLAGIRTAVTRVAHIAPTRTFRAVTQFDGRSREEVPARAEGRVEEVRALRVGERVTRNQILATLQSESLIAAQEEFLAARKAAASLGAPDLVRSQVGAARRRLQVLGMAEAQVGELERTGRALRIQPIRSPRDGILLEVRVQPGQYVSAGSSLFTVGLPDRIWVETWLLATEASRFPEGTEASVRVEGVGGEPIRGRLEHVRQSTTLAGSVTLAHIGIPNAGDRILPGMQAWVTFRESGKHVLGVPPSALLRSSTSTQAWVRAGKDTFVPRMVKTGVESSEAVEIVDGIQAGEEVVVEGAYLLSSEWTLRQGAGMVHAGH